MNASTFLSGPFADAVGLALFHLVWQGALVAAILASALELMTGRTANARYVVSCAALALLLILGVSTAWRSYHPESRRQGSAATAVGMVPGTESGESSTVSPSSWRARFATTTAEAHRHLRGIVLIWLIGVVVLSARLLLTWIRAQRLTQHGTQPASREWQNAVSRLADSLRLRSVVRLVESTMVEVPTVIGWMRPVILLPASTLLSLSPQQIEMVLAHELAHIRRYDFLVNLLQALVETLMFYHPAVWWMSRRVRIERENCCDDLAVAICGNPLQYARALTRLEELRAAAPSHPAIAASGGSLVQRIRRLAGLRTESAPGPSRWAAALVVLTILAALIITPSLPAMAGQSEKKAQAPTPAAVTVDVSASPEIDVDTEAEVRDVESIGEVFDDYTPAPPTPPTPPVAATARHAARRAPVAPPPPPVPSPVAVAPVTPRCRVSSRVAAPPAPPAPQVAPIAPTPPAATPA